MKKRKLQSDKGGGGSLRSSNAALPPPHVRQRRTARTRPERWELKTWRFKVGWKGRRRTPTIRRSSNVFSLLFRLGVSASCPAAFAFSPPVICPHRAQHFPPNPRKSVSFFLFLFLKLTHKKDYYSTKMHSSWLTPDRWWLPVTVPQPNNLRWAKYLKNQLG